MKSILLPVVCLSILLSFCNKNSSNPNDDVKQIIIEKYAKMRTTLKSGDPDYVLAMHSKNATLFLQNRTQIVGIAALKPFYEKVALSGIDIKKHTNNY